MTTNPAVTADRTALREALEALPAVGPIGNGSPDWCSVHGDIPGTVSIVEHVNTTHGMTYDEWRVLDLMRSKLTGVDGWDLAHQRRAAAILAALAAPEAPTGPTADVLRAFERHAIEAILSRPNADPDDDAAIAARAAARLAAQPEPSHTDDPATHDPRCISVSRWHVGECYLPQPEPHAITGSAVHAAWRDGMLAQGREVAPERMAWDTLSQQDRDLDDGIAAALAQPEPSAPEGLDDRLARALRADQPGGRLLLLSAYLYPDHETDRGTSLKPLGLARLIAATDAADREATRTAPIADAISARINASILSDLSAIDARPAAQPEPEYAPCSQCGGGGWVTGIGADPLPSGEPGEPYQTQETCPACGGAGTLGYPAQPEPSAPEGLDVNVLARAKWAALTAEVGRLTGLLREAYTLLVSAEPTLIRDAKVAPNLTSAAYKAMLRDRVTEWLEPFRDHFDEGLRAALAGTHDQERGAPDGVRTCQVEHGPFVCNLPAGHDGDHRDTGWTWAETGTSAGIGWDR